MLTRVTRAMPLVLLALAGCGSTRESSQPQAASTSAAATATATATAMTHNEFVKALNRSCAADTPKAKRLGAQFESAMERGQIREAGRIYRDAGAVLKAHVTRISVLQVPKVDRSAMRRYMASEKRIMGYGDRMTESLLDNDLAGVQLLVKDYQREQKRRITAAIDMGADKCGG